jgi:anti-sigma regulatory factor (Ser/Thr protein kinase)
MQLEKWVHDFASHYKLSDRMGFNLKLVLTEAVTNVMDYAGQPDGKIEIGCTLCTESVFIEIIDEGAPFDPTAHKPVIFPKTLEDARPGGLGIHLMRQKTKDMHYRRENDRNILCMSLPIQ